MRGSMLSRRYALALADVAQKDGQLERVRDELNALANALSSNPAFRVMARTGRRSRKQERAFFRRISGDLRLARHTARLLDYLVQKRRTALLPPLASSFADEVDRRLSLQKARVTTAMPLTEAQRGDLVGKLGGLTGAKITIEETVDESLIAGFQVRLDGRFFDGSLLGRLNRIKERMAHGG